MVKGDDMMNDYYEYDEELRKELLSYLEDNDMSRAEFARQAGCSETSINKFINKKYRLGRVVKRAISRRLGMEGENEAELYHSMDITDTAQRNITLLVLNGEIHRLKNELEFHKERLYKLEWKRDQLHELLKGL